MASLSGASFALCGGIHQRRQRGAVIIFLRGAALKTQLCCCIAFAGMLRVCINTRLGGAPSDGLSAASLSRAAIIQTANRQHLWRLRVTPHSAFALF